MTMGTKRSLPLLPPPGKERLAEIARRHRAGQAERRAKYGDPEEALDRFAEQVFGSEAAQQVLIDYLRERTSWLDSDTDAEDDSQLRNGR
jgi:hypothetical protein